MPNLECETLKPTHRILSKGYFMLSWVDKTEEPSAITQWPNKQSQLICRNKKIAVMGHFQQLYFTK